MDKNIFFREATLLICSSLEIEIALGRCRDFINRYVPVDTMVLDIYNDKTKNVKILAKADSSGCEKLNLELKVPGEIVKLIDNRKRFDGNLCFIRQSNKDPLIRKINSSLGLPDAEFIALLLGVEGKRCGVASFYSYNQTYTEEHAQLVSLLQEPLSIATANAIKHRELTELKNQLAFDNKDLKRRLFTSVIEEIVGVENGLQDVMLMVHQVSLLNNTVLLLGETGVGKEVVANAIHHSSNRKNGPFIKVNCGAIPDTLIDSELFGHEKGSFTGAVSRKRGMFERADKGTIFLDEIGELPLQAQVRLLRVLQSHEIERIGGTQPIKLDIRVIAATHQNLDNMVNEGRFREDLFFRLNVFPIQIPPLRQRKEDIPAFIEHFWVRKSKELGIMPQPSLSSIDMEPLLEYEWPGNVRELGNFVERTLIQQRSGSILPTSTLTGSKRKVQPLDFRVTEEDSFILQETISEHFKKVLAITEGKIDGPKGAAALMGIPPSTLRHKMNKYGISYGRNYSPK